MTKPDFERWVAIASNGTPGLAITRSEELLTALNDAYAAGRADERERCAEIADAGAERWKKAYVIVENYSTQVAITSIITAFQIAATDIRRGDEE